MKKLPSLLFFCIGMISCKHHESKPVGTITYSHTMISLPNVNVNSSSLQFVSLLRAIKCNPKNDSIYLYSDGHIVSTQKQETERYFLISYVSASKDETNYYPIEGNEWFSCQGDFPSKNTIDSIVYDGFPNKRKCYKHIIIKSIYEFKSADDFYSFGFHYKWDTIPKVKKCCVSSKHSTDTTYMLK